MPVKDTHDKLAYCLCRDDVSFLILVEVADTFDGQVIGLRSSTAMQHGERTCLLRKPETRRAAQVATLG